MVLDLELVNLPITPHAYTLANKLKFMLDSSSIAHYMNIQPNIFGHHDRIHDLMLITIFY